MAAVAATASRTPPIDRDAKRNLFKSRADKFRLVGAARFELATTCTPCRYATRLRYAPKWQSISAHRTGRLLSQQLDDALQLLLQHSKIDRAPVESARRRSSGRHGARRRGAQAFVEAVTRAADGESLLVEQLPDAADQQHFMMLVVAAIAAAFDRPQLGEFLLPVAQHVRLDPAQLAHFSNGEVALCRNRRQAILGRLAFHASAPPRP